eukprot:5656823-Pyramimonas_sp.AAC.1
MRYVCSSYPGFYIISGIIAMCFGQSYESTRRLAGAFPADEEYRARSSVGHEVRGSRAAVRAQLRDCILDTCAALARNKLKVSPKSVV